jgi:hypothetical protein
LWLVVGVVVEIQIAELVQGVAVQVVIALAQHNPLLLDKHIRLLLVVVVRHKLQQEHKETLGLIQCFQPLLLLAVAGVVVTKTFPAKMVVVAVEALEIQALVD